MKKHGANVKNTYIHFCYRVVFYMMENYVKTFVFLEIKYHLNIRKSKKISQGIRPQYDFNV
jgi:hypothetical protein